MSESQDKLMKELERTAGTEPMNSSLNPKFPYRMERAKWYLMFMLMERIISVNEFDDLYSRLPEEFK